MARSKRKVSRSSRSPSARSARSSRPRDAVALLKAYHREVAGWFEQFEKLIAELNKLPPERLAELQHEWEEKTQGETNEELDRVLQVLERAARSLDEDNRAADAAYLHQLIGRLTRAPRANPD